VPAKFTLGSACSPDSTNTFPVQAAALSGRTGEA
jgi:hypothetical protein